jgi:hypothetical protein
VKQFKDVSRATVSSQDVDGFQALGTLERPGQVRCAALRVHVRAISD